MHIGIYTSCALARLFFSWADCSVLQEKFERVVGLNCRRNAYAAVERGNKNMVDGGWGNVLEVFAISRGQLWISLMQPSKVFTF